MDISRFREALRAGCIDLFAASVHWKSAPSAPPPPDYSGAATATAAGNKENTIAAQQGSMVNQFTPYGNLTYTPGDYTAQGNPTYNANYSLSPIGQQLLNQQNALSTGLFGAQNQALQQVQNQGPMDLSGVQDTADRAYAAMTSRLDPQWAQNQTSYETQLVNQGLRPGSEAFDNAMRVFNQGKNDAYQQARLGAIATMPQTYQLASAAYNQPYNTLASLRTGSQIQNPTFSAQPGQQAVPGPNYLGAAQATGQYNQGLYNTQVGQANSFNSGLMNLGGALGSAYLYGASDIRLKSDIVKIGEHPLGIGIYEYTIFGKRDRGVMAQEVLHVKPEAVLMHPDGYLMVDYGRL